MKKRFVFFRLISLILLIFYTKKMLLKNVKRINDRNIEFPYVQINQYVQYHLMRINIYMSEQSPKIQKIFSGIRDFIKFYWFTLQVLCHVSVDLVSYE